MRLFESEFVRFLIAGTANTLLIYLLYLLLLLVANYETAYSVSYLAGIILAYWLATRYVFRTAWSWRQFVRFPSVYLVQYLSGLALMLLFVEYFAIDARIAPWIIVAVQVPMTFLLSKRIVTPKGAAEVSTSQKRDPS
jgi:putative flippase GtrA